MASILDRYGIKEVADVTFYELDDNGKPTRPVLYLDTLKVSTIEQTAEQAEARGGKGNPPLIIWDYGKEINVTLEDALFSAKSMAIMLGPDGKTYDKVNPKFYDATGATVDSASLSKDVKYFCSYDLLSVNAGVIEISAASFPGTYYVTGDTYARSEASGRDEFFQFIIPKAKMNAENTITLEAEGDPSVFNMSLRVMRPADGVMMKLVKYDLAGGTAASESNSATLIHNHTLDVANNG